MASILPIASHAVPTRLYDDDSLKSSLLAHRVTKKTQFLKAASASAALLGSGVLLYFILTGQQRHHATTLPTRFALSIPQNTILGTNLGGWLCLEDWLFSETAGVSVSGWLGSQGQGRSLPPVAAAPLEPFTGSSLWPSEGILTWRMNNTIGPQVTAEIFEAHRATFITSNDFEDMASAGVRAVRVPLSWTLFADALAPLSDLYRGVNERTTIVPDPVYHEQVAGVTIPRAWMADQIRNAGAAGLKVVLDMHSFPGGAQDASYSGVWPLRPAFWSNHSRIGKPVRMLEVGRWIAKALIQWVEVELDAEARRAIRAIQFMNEPAHMNYAPPFAQSYHPFAGYANETDILDWLSDAMSMFRSSSLPQAGIKVMVQLVETAFEDFYHEIPAWFERTFVPHERSTWVIVAHQYYAAYTSDCASSPAARDGQGFTCSDPTEESRLVMRRCVRRFTNLSMTYFEDWPQLAVAEFSLGTANRISQACSNRDVLAAFWDEQLDAFSEAGGGEFYFWSWKMPNAACFEPGWSLQHFAHGRLPNLSCASSVAAQG